MLSSVDISGLISHSHLISPSGQAIRSYLFLHKKDSCYYPSFIFLLLKPVGFLHIQFLLLTWIAAVLCRTLLLRTVPLSFFISSVFALKAT